MKITRLTTENVRAFTKINLSFSDTINLIVGENNSGKTTLLRLLYIFQQPTSSEYFTRLKYGAPKIKYGFDGLGPKPFKDVYGYELNWTTASKIFNKNGDHTDNIDHSNMRSLQNEPGNIFYPYFSKRKTVAFQEMINSSVVNNVTGTLENLYAKIDRLSSPQIPDHKKFLLACNSILGFEVGTTASPNGKKGAYIVDTHLSIDLLNMGEGVSNVLGLVVDLCVAKNQIFLIEEPENDIHPKALKALLDLVLETSASNQFFITTHSNIVLKHLGSLESTKVFHTKLIIGNDRMPTATVKEVPATPEARMCVLEDLGYENSDFEHWAGWLILEESSAEKIIRKYLIPWFAPKLENKLRTVSAKGESDVKTRFDDFNRLFTFLHLAPTYKNKAWVVIDAGEKEATVIKSLKTTYSGSGWDENQFKQFSQHDFESFYPAESQEDVTPILAIQDKQKKRAAKKELLAKVEAWIAEDEARAKEAFKTSAAEVIAILKEIASALR